MTTATKKKKSKKTNGRASQEEFPGFKKRIPSIDKASKELVDANDVLNKAKKDVEKKSEKLLKLMKHHRVHEYTTADNFLAKRKPGGDEKVTVKAKKLDKELADTKK